MVVRQDEARGMNSLEGLVKDVPVKVVVVFCSSHPGRRYRSEQRIQCRFLKVREDQIDQVVSLKAAFVANSSEDLDMEMLNLAFVEDVADYRMGNSSRALAAARLVHDLVRVVQEISSHTVVVEELAPNLFYEHLVLVTELAWQSSFEVQD